MEPVFFKTSPLLREAAELKIRELDRAKQTFKDRCTKPTEHLDRDGTLERLSALLGSFRTLDFYLEDRVVFSDVTHYVEHARDDLSISTDKLLTFEKQLQRKIMEYTNRLEVSSLHAELLKEAMAEDKSINTLTTQLTTVMDDDFEVVQDDTEHILSNFEKQASTANEIDVAALERYLASLMDVGEKSEALQELRTGLERFGSQTIQQGIEVEQDELMCGAMELLKSNRITSQKRQMLESYLQSPMVIKELMSILNFRSIHDWNWKNSERGIPTRVCQNSDQEYYVAIDEDIVDMLFLNAVANGWATKLKEHLEIFINAVKPALRRALTKEEVEKGGDFMIGFSIEPASPPRSPSPPPPPPPRYPPVPYRSSSKKKRSNNHRVRRNPLSRPPSPPPPRLPPAYHITTNDTLDEEREDSFIRDFFMSRLPSLQGCISKAKCPEEVQARLIKTLAAEVKLREAFDGEVYTSVHTFFPSTTLSHEAVLTVLKFLGVPDVFINFFNRFLKANLSSGPDRTVTRVAGVPNGHAMEIFFMEAIYFFLDLAVWKKTGVFLYRIYHDCYFVGTAEQGAQVEEEISKFSRVMGLESTLHHGPLRIGHLHLAPKKNPPRQSAFQISYSGLEFYARRAKERLDACTTIIEWIRVWNSTIGSYAAHLFGPLATALGTTHHAAVTEAYKRMFAIIFPGSNLTAHVTSMLRSHLNLPLDNPAYALEALIYLPHAYGGLGVKNPFTTLALARDSTEDPDADIQSYLKTEMEYHAEATSYLERIQPPDKGFMEHAELVRHRELISLQCPYYTKRPALANVYRSLLEEPRPPVRLDTKLFNELRRLEGRGDMVRVSRLSDENLWVFQLYSPECFERYGGLEVWCPEGVPMEAMKGVRGDIWDDDCDDGSSTSS